MQLTNKDYVSRALTLVGTGLQPAIAATLQPRILPTMSWTDLLAKRDEANGKYFAQYDATDVSLMLRVMTENLGNLGRPFDGRLGRAGGRHVSELREIRNSWAHGGEFSDEDAYRAVDTAQRLLALMDAAEAAEVAELRRELQNGVANAAPLEPAAAIPVTLESPEVVREGPEVEVAAVAPPTIDEGPQDPPLPSAPTSASLATIQIFTAPVISYAMAHNRVPVISQVVIRMDGPSIPGAKLTVGIDTAEGPLGEPRDVFVDLVEGEETTVSAIPFALDPLAMSRIEDERPASVIATLIADGTVVAQKRTSIQVIAANQWLQAPKNTGLEMLAAHVQPNDPALATLVDEASEILKATTGSGAFVDVYEAEDPTKVDDIAHALIAAMRARRVRYSMPPSSWGSDGQRVRTAEEVLDGRLGTCLDTTLVLAAALERVGLRPLIFLVDGHAFAGYWRFERGLQTPAIDDPAQITNLINVIDLGLVEVVETTLLTEDQAEADMDDITGSPKANWLHGDVKRILGVTDVISARNSGVFPLPARSMATDGSVVITEYSAPVVAPRKYVPAPAPEGATQPARPAAPPRVEKWKNNLLDLSLRNRLINFPASARIPLAVPESGLAELEDYLNAGQAISILPADQLSALDQAQGRFTGAALPEADRLRLLGEKKVYSSVSSDAYLRKFRALAYKAKTVVEETGANNLYVALGSLVWTIKDREIRSPLILVPVTLRARTKGGGYHLSIDETGASTPNYCLLEKLRLEFGLQIPGLADPALDTSGIDLDAALLATRSAIAKAGIAARVEPTVDLAILQFAKFRLWKDLDENWAALSANSLVKHLIEQPQEAFVDVAASPDAAAGSGQDVDLDDLLTTLPVSADSSQLAAVAAAAAGRTFVLEGPPGTGKSQTITNLLARSIADGKRVLFVAEKKAALDVVQTRLEAVGLGPFTLDLHDRGSRPNEIRTHLKKALAVQTSVDEDGLIHTSNAVDTARRALSRYTAQVHEPNAAGQSYYAAHNAALAAADIEFILPISAEWAGRATRNTLADVRSLLRDVPDAGLRARPGHDHPWSFVDPADPDNFDGWSIELRVRRYDEILRRLPLTEELGQVVAEASTPARVSIIEDVARREPLSSELLTQARSPEWLGEADAIKGLLVSLVRESADVLAVVTPAILFFDAHAFAEAAEAAQASGFFGRKKRQKAILESLTPFRLQGTEIDLEQLVPLGHRFVEIRGAAESLWHRINGLDGVSVEPGWNPFVPEAQAALLARVDAIVWLSSTTNSTAYTDESAFRHALHGFAASNRAGGVADLLQEYGKALTDLLAADGTSPDSWSAWLDGRRLVEAWSASMVGRDLSSPRGVGLPQWLGWRRALAPLRAIGLDEAYEALLVGDVPSDEASDAFERGLAGAAEFERYTSTGLREFDAARHNRQIERYTESARELRRLQVNVAPHRVVDRRTFDPKTAGGRVGELRKQLDRSRGGLSVRDLITQYGDLIIQATPCILVSPDSVARFFPAKGGQFDIVVFDEASQVRVADAIGAMGRADSVVVVGDSKQMPPTAVAEASTSDDDESTSANDFLLQDEESILAECVQARVERQFLTWHYRSQDESLIAFSNRFYYDDQLTSFPAPAHGQIDGGVAGHGISLVRVNGHFVRSGPTRELRTNRVEAEAIVAEIRKRFDASPDEAPSVGVVTFNAQQRTLVEALLRDTGEERIAEALDSKQGGLFVKNLENVQGDERDAILFSTAFSKNDNGVLPLNFGPLTAFGGERRLNVAITRARRQVVLFSSFDPQDLRADETTSRGIKDLRAYLELAQKGPDQTLRTRTGPLTTDRHRESIADALRSRGLEVRTDVGLSDFKVDLAVATAESPQSPVLAVLLDGFAWSTRKTVADRDALPVEVLEGLMKWPGVERVWLPEWVTDPETVTSRLLAAVDSAVAVAAAEEAVEATTAVGVTPPGEVASPVDIPREPASPTTTDGAALPLESPGFDREYAPVSARAISAQLSDVTVVRPESSSGSEFVEWRPRVAGGIEVLDRWRERDNYRSIQGMINEVVAAEGPVQSLRLAKLVASAFGLGKVSGPRMLSILECVPVNLFQTPDEKFIWPDGVSPDAYRDYRSAPTGSSRAVETISNREITNAMVDLVTQGAGVSEEELLRSTLGLFGGIRLTTAIRGRLLEALRFAESAGRLARGDGDLITTTAETRT